MGFSENFAIQCLRQNCLSICKCKCEYTFFEPERPLTVVLCWRYLLMARDGLNEGKQGARTGTALTFLKLISEVHEAKSFSLSPIQ